MKTYYISVTETLNKIVEVHAEDSSEALQKAEDAYYNGEIALDILKDTGEARALIYKVGSDKPDECISLN